MTSFEVFCGVVLAVMVVINIVLMVRVGRLYQRFDEWQTRAKISQAQQDKGE